MCACSFVRQVRDSTLALRESAHSVILEASSFPHQHCPLCPLDVRLLGIPSPRLVSPLRLAIFHRICFLQKELGTEGTHGTTARAQTNAHRTPTSTLTLDQNRTARKTRPEAAHESRRAIFPSVVDLSFSNCMQQHGKSNCVIVHFSHVAASAVEHITRCARKRYLDGERRGGASEKRRRC